MCASPFSENAICGCTASFHSDGTTAIGADIAAPFLMRETATNVRSWNMRQLYDIAAARESEFFDARARGLDGEAVLMVSSLGNKALGGGLSGSPLQRTPVLCAPNERHAVQQLMLEI